MFERLRTRRVPASPATPREPTPYCDRLTLADAFAEDQETRSSAEDRRTEHKPVGSYADVLVETVAPRTRALRRPSVS